MAARRAPQARSASALAQSMQTPSSTSLRRSVEGPRRETDASAAFRNSRTYGGAKAEAHAIEVRKKVRERTKSNRERPEASVKGIRRVRTDVRLFLQA